MIGYTNRGNGKSIERDNSINSKIDIACGKDSIIQQYIPEFPVDVLHRNLYKYRESIDYKSLIYVICNHVDTEYKLSYKEIGTKKEDDSNEDDDEEENKIRNHVEENKIRNQSYYRNCLNTKKVTYTRLYSIAPHSNDESYKNLVKRMTNINKSTKDTKYTVKSDLFGYSVPLHFLLIDKHKRDIYATRCKI